MIKRITLNKVTSYQNETILKTDKKVNLLYGLNGSGKTTISNYLYEIQDHCFSDCSVSGIDNETKILVYNQKFIQDNFYNSDELKGIFTLSKENKEVEEEIKKLTNEKSKLEEKKKNLKENELPKTVNNIKLNRETSEKTIWNIKTKYGVEEKIFDYCLSGLKGTKSKLFEYISAIKKVDKKPEKSLEILEEEAKPLQDKNTQSYLKLGEIKFDSKDIETNELLSKVIVGNQNLAISMLINKLENTDWVRQGLSFLPEVIDDEEQCPFCQQKTITKKLYQEIKEYFDESYQRDIESLKQILKSYSELKASLPSIELYTKHSIFQDKKESLETLYSKLISIIDLNIQKVENKIKTPSSGVGLETVDTILTELNELINNANDEIDKHNIKLKNRKEELNKIKEYFWKIQRYEYSQTLDRYLKDKNKYEEEKKQIESDIIVIQKQIDDINTKLEEEQDKTVNIDKAINSINDGLKELGLIGFSIVKYEDNKYKLKRTHKDMNQTFPSLSEGEKMIISFLYFVEQCKGKMDTTETTSKKIVVIDDPMSSLSHLFVFNIAQLIKREFFNGSYTQIFVLTHSLYFFYELTDTNHKRRKEHQKLFRVQKNMDSSFIEEMKYEEIQNDYQAYWMIINDENQHPAIIANAMRNIIEYFVNFVEKNDFNNVFQEPELKQDKYISFNRYMNRESHSLGQNIFDYKEFDYRVFKDGLKYIFDELNYVEHYKKMAKI